MPASYRTENVTPQAEARDPITVDPLVEGQVAALLDRESHSAASRPSLVGPESSKSPGRSPPASQSDEWSTFPRTNFPLAELVLGTYPRQHQLASVEDVVDHLYRNVYLNPGDKVIPLHARPTLALAIRPLFVKLAQTRSLVDTTAVKEFRGLLDSGKQEAVNLRDPKELETRLTDDERRLLASAREQAKRAIQKARGKPGENNDPTVVVPEIMFKGEHPTTFTVRDGKLYGATINELPSTKRVKELEEYFMLELANGVLEWFTIQGCLGPEQKRVRLEQTMLAVTRK